jgi:hypothetical protein
MTAPSIALQRRVVTERARSVNVPLVTPDSPSALREAAALIVSATSERTYAEVREGVSFYAPRVVGRTLSLLPSAVTGVLEVAGFNVSATGLVLLSERAWNERPASTWAHERSHELRDAVVSAGGVVSSVAWAVGYLAHPTIRGWEEGTCRVNDLVGLVVFEGWPVDDALTAAKVGAALYRLDDPGREVYLAALDSAADSLRAGQLPGVDTEVHHIARMLRREGWDAGPWAQSVGE